jgi:RNA recognition motif-containing protein
VKNFLKGTTEEQLKDMFAEFGEIESVHIPKVEGSEELKDFGYVCFKKAEDAEKALDAMNKKILENG